MGGLTFQSDHLYTLPNLAARPVSREQVVKVGGRVVDPGGPEGPAEPISELLSGIPGMTLAAQKVWLVATIIGSVGKLIMLLCVMVLIVFVTWSCIAAV